MVVRVTVGGAVCLLDRERGEKRKRMEGQGEKDEGRLGKCRVLLKEGSNLSTHCVCCLS